MVEYVLKIFRFDPTVDKEPRYVSYKIMAPRKPTILEALKLIFAEQDDTLSFRESCGLGKCGSCTVMMDKRPVLACQTTLSSNKVLIEPLANHKVIKDLVVDRSQFEERLKKSRVFFSRPEYLRLSNEDIDWSPTFRQVTQCLECLACESACPAFEYNQSSFPGPAILTQLSRLTAHPLNMGKEEQIAWLDGINNCTACMTCSHVCPKDVDPFRKGIVPLRTTITERGLVKPKTQQGFAQQYAKNRSLVPSKKGKRLYSPTKKRTDTAVFLGCMFSERYPADGQKVINLLAELDFHAKLLEDVGCCGGPLLWIGEEETARKAMVNNIETIIQKGIRHVITPCPGCAVTLKTDYVDIYREMTGKDLPFDVYDITEVLGLDTIKNLSLPKKTKVAYHSPCHHGKAQDLDEPAITAISNIGSIELVTPTPISSCCGGMTSSGNPFMALDMAGEIIHKAENIGAEMLITSCVFCRDNLRRAARKERSSLQVEQLSVVLAEMITERKGY